MGSSSPPDADRRARVRQQAVITELSQHAIESTDLDSLLTDAVAAVAKTLEMEYCALLEVQPDEGIGQRRYGVGWGTDPDETEWLSIADESQIAYTLRTDDPVVIDDMDAETRFVESPHLADHDVISGISVRVGPAADPWGVLETYTTSQRLFTDADAMFVQHVADVLASALEADRERNDRNPDRADCGRKRKRDRERELDRADHGRSRDRSRERDHDLRERERRLEQYEAYTDEILDAIDDVFYVIDANGDLQRWNRSLAEVTGYEPDELATMEPADFFDGETAAAAEAAIREGFETGSVEVELELATKDGDTVPFEFVASTLEDPGGNTVLAGIGRDVTERVERERALEESERRYRTLAQHFPNGAAAVYDHDLTYTLAAGEQLGETLPTADRLEGDRMPDIFPDHTAADLEPVFRAAIDDGEIGSTETTFDGHHWRVWAAPLRDADGEIFAGLSFAQDVTEQIERERRLERYGTIVEVVDDGVYVVDADGHFTMVNETYADMLGYDPDDLVGEHVSLVVDDDVVERVGELEAAEDADWPTIEADLYTADGDTIPVEATFAMLPTDDDAWHRVGVARDISERKSRERALEESERRYRTLVENFPDGAVGLYDEDLEYIVVGGEVFDDLGIQESEVTGATLHERYPDDLVDDIEPYFEAVFDGESNTFEYQAHGRDVWAHTLPVRNEDDEIFAGMVMVQDVTERREYQRRLEQSNERLEQFAYAASHDLQEPLRMVSSYLQLLERRYGDELEGDGEEFLAFAVDGAERMREMIDALLAYSRVETGGEPFASVDLNAVLEDVLADLRLQIDESDAEITVEELPHVEGDASQLRQVFQNLLSNAITYSGDEPPRVHVSADRRDEEWVLSVRDEGIGIDPADQGRVFDVFDRLHSREEYAGTGIGLALCERIVERHGGDIWVESEPGDGSTFSFTLPVSQPE